MVEATKRSVEKGQGPTLRYLPRTQRIALGLHEVLRPGEDEEREDMTGIEAVLLLDTGTNEGYQRSAGSFGKPLKSTGFLMRFHQEVAQPI